MTVAKKLVLMSIVAILGLFLLGGLGLWQIERVAHFDIMATRLIGAAGTGSALDLFAADDIALALETMGEALRDAARALDALTDDAAIRALCADQFDALRTALADRRARIDRGIAALRPTAVEPLRDADTAGWLRRMAAGIQRE